jgi:hypothetical protein
MKLIGWVDTGLESYNLEVMKKESVERQLASSCLQLVFLGYTGFRFPFANFPTKGVTASELTIQCWHAISKLRDYGFSIDFILQDGGEQNRQFAKLHFLHDNMIANKCLVKSLINPSRYIAIVQDFSHVVKKLRNACISSGDRTKADTKYTRDLKIGQYAIRWIQWVQTIKWDRDTNSRPLHYRVSDEHLFPNSCEKMRNKLAEDMLGYDMLNVMKCFSSFLHDGDYLNGTINFLEQTALLISIFHDKRPITSMEDLRLNQLQDIYKWFCDWETKAKKPDNNNTSKPLPSWECMEDVKSLLLGFHEVCRIHLENFPNSSIFPNRFNSDIVENHFNQERGVHNGNLTNPNYSSYCNTVGSIIMSQSVKSKGRKSNAGIPAAAEYRLPQEPSLKKTKHGED